MINQDKADLIMFIAASYILRSCTLCRKKMSLIDKLKEKSLREITNIFYLIFIL